MTTTQQITGCSLLDDVEEQISEGRVREALNQLRGGLQMLRSGLPAEEWRSFAKHGFASHRLRAVLQQSPVTRSFHGHGKGFAGNARTLDVVYRGGEPDSELSALSSAIQRWQLGLPSFQALVSRRDMFSREIEEVCGRIGRPRILSIDCGHLREPQFERLLENGWRPEIVAAGFDEDEVAFVEREYGQFGIRALHLGLGTLLRSDGDLGAYDFIYAAHVYDRLDGATARQLTSSLVEVLKPGGRLMVANMAPGAPDAAYLECCLNWWPIYRDEQQMAQLLSNRAAAQLTGHIAFGDGPRHTMYLDAAR